MLTFSGECSVSGIHPVSGLPDTRSTSDPEVWVSPPHCASPPATLRPTVNLGATTPSLGVIVGPQVMPAASPAYHLCLDTTPQVPLICRSSSQSPRKQPCSPVYYVIKEMIKDTDKQPGQETHR